PNTVYLVAMDPDQVEEALGGEFQTRAPDYLAKIVQTSVRLPVPDRAVLLRLFVERLEEIVGEPRTDPYDDAEWQRLLERGLRPLLNPPRDVDRLLNAMRVSYPPVRGQVNLTDFVGLEAIRLCAPQVHHLIQEHPGKFGAGSGLEAVFPVQ